MKSVSIIVVAREVLTLHGVAVVVRVANFSAAGIRDSSRLPA